MTYYKYLCKFLKGFVFIRITKNKIKEINLKKIKKNLSLKIEKNFNVDI